MSKRLHAGRAAEGGLTAAELAAELGQRWMIDEITVKPYAACSDIRPLIDAALQLRAAGVNADDIERIEADVPSKAAEQNAMDGTTSVMAAQYSGPFNAAAAFLADPTDPATYTPDRITDPRIAALQAKVAPLRASPELDATYAWKMAGRLRVHMTDGTIHERTVSGQRGSMHRPLTAADQRAKLHRVIGDQLDVAHLEATLASLPAAPDVTQVLAVIDNGD